MKLTNTFLIANSIFTLGMISASSTLAAPPIAIDQGSRWTPSARSDFYSRDQGSRIIPFSWIAALKQPNGTPFMDTSLSRYGYLPNESSSPPGLPIGFMVVKGKNGDSLGMNCAACHTRQIEVGDKSYRIDGGPAIVDFQRFLADLDSAVNTVLTNQQALTDFSHAVLGIGYSPDKEAKLREEVKAWHLPYHTIMEGSLPKDNPWGPARADAIAMIFNRLTGLGIAPSPTNMILANIQRADAPVRYPFLWNASRQDKTQWAGFVKNGNDTLALTRNHGEVIGVFGVFRPKKSNVTPLGINYVNENSTNFNGLIKLERLLKKIGQPVWPGEVDLALAAKGEVIFGQTCATGCHEKRDGKVRPPLYKTWSTPVLDVGTDSRAYDILEREVDTGVLAGARIPFTNKSIKPREKASEVLNISIFGSILQHPLKGVPTTKNDLLPFESATRFPNYFKGTSMQSVVGATVAAPSYAYESRVLRGIWAAAPYLHNGSVPTLAELLKPAEERISSFKIGPNYDLINIGLAMDQTKFDYTLQTSDCSNRNSGNSRCGHEYGTTLSRDEKKALLEYLKTL